MSKISSIIGEILKELLERKISKIKNKIDLSLAVAFMVA